ncbi:MAG: hypothetical protein GY788_08710 [bacterium]|nr:hypothetical protein [bacterium]
MKVATEIKAEVLAARGRFFRNADFADSSNYAAVRKAISRLVSDGELIHIRTGLYWRGRKTQFGMAQPSVMQIAEAVAGSAGVGHASAAAANVLGLSSLVPAVIEIAVPTRAPSSFGMIRFVSRAGREKRLLTRLNQYEVALLEVLETWEDNVEETYACAVVLISQLLQNEEIRTTKLVVASDSEPGVVRARLRQLLTDAGYAAEAQAIRCPLTATRPLPVAA